MRSMKTLYNGCTLIFIGLSVGVCLLALLWVSETVDVPGSLAPETAVPIPTLVARPTLPPETGDTAAPEPETATDEAPVVPDPMTPTAPPPTEP
ncbi:MAG: hypothetical protein ACLFTK_06130 [Anaerolineales bacterium]